MSGPARERSTTMHKTLRRKLRTFAVLLTASLATGAASAATVSVNLRATRTSKPLPGGVTVPVWAYASCNANFTNCGAATVPGPVIRANVGDTLSIRVRNALGPQTRTSLVIPGQPGNGTPVMAAGRVRSFTTETPNNGTVTYTWTPVKPGTYLYQSGTRPSIQVPMGLYGGLVVSSPAAYPGGPPYNPGADPLLLFSEIDKVQNDRVDAAADEAAYPPTIDYDPKYFLLNGTAFDPAQPGASTIAGLSTGSTLIRLANAGLRTHVATIVGLDLEVRAEDGNLYPTPRLLSAVSLPAGKTHDALATLSNDRTYALYDRMLDLTNADAPDGGMLAYLKVGSGSPVIGGGGAAANDAYTVLEDSTLTRPAPGVLANDGGLGNASLVTSPGHGSLSLNADGSFAYTPTADFAGSDVFVYSAAGGGATSTATVRLTVTPANDPPVAREDSFSNTFGAALTVPAPGVLANDGDPEGDAVTAVLATPVPGLALDANGSLSFSGGPGTTTFQYQAKDPSGALSEPVTVTLDLKPVRGLVLNVVGVEPGGGKTAVTEYRWLVEEDANFHPDPAHPELPSLGTSFHRSHMPVVAQGCQGAGCGQSISELALDPARHYYVSVLPRSAGSGTGFTNGAAPIPPGAARADVYVNRLPLPPAQMSILVFEDSSPTNGAPDGNEQGLGGFEIVIDDGGGRYGMNGGRMLVDKDGNLLTNAKAGSPGCPASAGSRPGVILTCPDGTAIVRNLPPAKYGVSAVPPVGSRWVQTTTIEGTKANDAWVKPNEPTYFQEFGPPGYHVFQGFVNPDRLVKPAGGGNTVRGTVTNLRISRPPDQTLHDAGTNDALKHTTAWVGLNSANGSGPNIAAVKADGEGGFSISGVPDGTYQLVVWDDYLDQIIAFRTVTVRDGGGGDLGNVPVFQWFSRLEHNVFLDKNEDGKRDDDEPGLIEQAINLRFRDGSIYQTYPTDHTGFVPFDQVFPFFNWLVAEVDYTRLKPTGVTVTVDAGGAAADHLLNPQDQTTGICPPGNTCTTQTRTEKGPQLLQAVQGFIGQTSLLDWGKAPYKPGENGGISGIVYYASTRAENNPRLAAADNWEPGIPSVKVRLYREVEANGGGKKLALVNEVETDSWDKTPPTGCPGADPGDAAMLGPGQLTKCYDGMRNWNQIRPGVFDGGYMFSDIPPGKYVVEVVPPTGYELVKEEDKNVDFGDAYALAPAVLMLPNLALARGLPDQAIVQEAMASAEPEPGLAQGACVGELRTVPQYLSLFEDQQVEAPYAGASRPLCDRKEVLLSDQAQAGANFFLFTSTPIASHFTGMILDDLSQEFDPNSPQFGEKWAPPFVPVSVRDWTGRELSRLYADRWGRINGLVPSTFTANVPMPSGYAPNMVMTCMNDPGPIPADPANPASPKVTDPQYDPRYSNFCYTFQYMPGTTTYLDTPVLPTSAFAAGADAPVDCALPTGTPAIRQVDGSGTGPFVTPGGTVTLLSMGKVQVPNPLYAGPGGPTPKTIERDYGFGNCTGRVLFGNVGLPISSWSDGTIQVTVPAAFNRMTDDLTVVRCPAAGGQASVGGITLTVSNHANDVPIHVAPGQSISDAIAAAQPGALIIVDPGTYDELVVMAKPVRLQGSGAGATFINAVKRPAERLAQWRERIDGLVASGAIDPLPGQTFAGGGLEPTTLGTEEGAGITVLAPNPTSSADPRWANRFRPSNNAANATRFTAARIDGLTVTGGDTGGGIFVNGWAHSLQITNNRVYGNQGFHHGGIRVGRPFLELDPQVQPYGLNKDVRIANNVVTQNGALDGSGGGGVALCTGSDGYRLTGNWVCGNFSQGHGGGIAHVGRSDDAQISRNRILFNQSFDQGLNRHGGGVYVGGEPPLAGALSAGTGRNLTIDANLIQGNQAGAGHGGGLRLERVNGADRTLGCFLDPRNAVERRNPCFRVEVTNNLVVNNVAGWSGGGISMLDALRVQIVNNTVARNDSTATVGSVFDVPGDPNRSTRQPAGVSSELHSPALLALAPGTYSDPGLVNNVIWGNRAFNYVSARLEPAVTSCTDPATDYWDLGVVGSDAQLHPRYSILTSLNGHGNYSGNNNLAGSPQFAADYCNGARSGRLLPEVTTLQIAPALDEGGNWIDVRYGPISLTGDYHIGGASAARSNANAAAAPPRDFDGQGRPLGAGTDRGADERP